MIKQVELYPTNWLYNAGVVGFLKVLSHNPSLFKFVEDYVIIKKPIEDLVSRNESSPIEGVPFWHYWYVFENESWGLRQENLKDGERNIKFRDVNHQLNVNVVCKVGKDGFASQEDFLVAYYRNASSLFPHKNGLYPNYYPNNRLADFDYFAGYFENKLREASSKKKPSYEVCSFCQRNDYELEPIDGKFMKTIMPSYSGFPNAYFNLSEEGLDKICALCQFFIIHHHLAFTKLPDGSEIFINAPSFELMYNLNLLAKEWSDKKALEILGMSLIDYSLRSTIAMNNWTRMNIEVVVKKGDLVDFHTLPQHTVDLLLDREIASLIAQIGEFSVLKYVLDGNYEKLLKLLHYAVGARLEDSRFREMFEKSFSRHNPAKVIKLVSELYGKIVEKGV